MAKAPKGNSTSNNRKAVNDNRSVQKNPTSPTYYKDRGVPVPSNLPSAPKQDGK